jgi:hypothetical protein
MEMSLLKDLNDVKLDISEFDKLPLSEYEQKRILKDVHNKIHPKKQKKKRLGLSVAIVAACMISFTLTIDKGIIAHMPFVGEPIEKYINQNENLNYSSYKTAIGETAENSLGKLTLNEVMLDDQRILLSATFEPADGVKFDYQTFIKPTVKVNGQEYTVTTGGQSIELNDSMFTIYNDIDLSEVITTEDVNIEVSYDTWRYHRDDEKVIEQPRTFDVQMSQSNLLVEKKVFEMNETITLNNGEIVTIEKVVTTPMSTTVYYDLSKSKSESIYFDIQSEDGVQSAYEYPMTAFTSNDLGDVSVIRFDGLTLGDTKYFLVARNSNHELLSNPIPIN